MYKKLICLNLVILFVISLFGTNGFAVTQNNKYDKYIIIDGKEFDASKSASGDGWRYYHNRQYENLKLTSYNGGSIYANVDLDIGIDNTNEITIESDLGYGIFIDGNLSFTTYANADGSKKSKLTVYGTENYEAIYVTGNLKLTDEIIAQGEKKQAVYGGFISISANTTVFVGDCAENANVGEYINQTYLRVADKHYEFNVTLNGNGGETFEGQTDYRVRFISSTPASLMLKDYDSIFVNGDKHFLGWNDSKGTFLKYGKYFFNAYNFEETLFAHWEDDVNKAVYLKNYYMDYDYKVHTEMTGGTVVEPVKVGDDFTFPNLKREGYFFEGWLSEEGKLFQPGEKITITKSESFTASFIFIDNVLIIEGKQYGLDEDAGSSSLGWEYFAQACQLNIYENYSGKPIIITKNVRICLEGSIKGENNQPAIYVDGNAEIFIMKPFLSILGNDDAPAIKTTKLLKIYNLCEEGPFIIQGGNTLTPAVEALCDIHSKTLYVGKNQYSLSLADKYTREHYVKIEGATSEYINLKGSATVPCAPVRETHTFLGWKNISYICGYIYPEDAVWYMPGDVVDAETEVLLQAQYLHNNRTSIAIVLDGNGGYNEKKSNYYVNIVSSASLSLYKIKDNPFYKEGFDFKEYNSMADGSGIGYSPGDSIKNDEETIIYNLYALWDDNSAFKCEYTYNEKKHIFDISLNQNVIKAYNYAFLIVAAYDEKRQFLDMSRSTINKDTTSKSMIIETENSITSVRIMIWDGVNILKPLCESKTINIR